MSNTPTDEPKGTAAEVAVEQQSNGSRASQDHASLKRVQRPWYRTLQAYVWDDPDKSKEEKRFLRKLDFFLLVAACYGYFCKNLDQANVNNAYVSGMKERLNMHGSELTYLSNMFTAGYVVGQIPAVILVSRVRPSYLVSTLEIGWAIVTFCCSAVKTTQQLYALRFLLGLCEAAYFPVMVYIIGSWYTKEERAKRMVLFYCTATFSAMFSGYLQAAAYANLDGVLGREGWQWLFIICGIISLPSGLLGYVMFPDFPENTHAFYLNKDEIAFARQRLHQAGFKPLGASAWDRKKIFRIASQWQFYVLPIGYFFIQASLPSQQPTFQLYLKSAGYSVKNVNVLPTAQYAIGGVTQIVAGMLSDSPLLKGRRWQAMTVMQAVTIFCTIVQAIWDVPHGLKMTAYFLSYSAAGVPGIYFSWFPELMPHDHEMRGFMTAWTNTFSFINGVWYSIAVWRTVEGPNFRAGFIAASCFGVGVILISLLLNYLEIHHVRKQLLPPPEDQGEDGEARIEPQVLVSAQAG